MTFDKEFFTFGAGFIILFMLFFLVLLGIPTLIIKLTERSKNKKILAQRKLPNEKDFQININWEISPIEWRERLRKLIWYTSLFFYPVLIYVLINNFFNKDHGSLSVSTLFYLYFSIAVGVLLIYAVAYKLVQFISFAGRSYTINKEGITVSKGNKSANYRWDQFEFFFIIPVIGENPNDEMRTDFLKKIRKVQGETVYLKIKPANWLEKLRTNILVIYTRPENFQAIESALRQKLPRGENYGVGWIHYLFK